MENFVCTKTAKVGYFKDEIREGERFSVIRNIRNECVLIVEDDRKPNIIASERELRKFGNLTGAPALGGV